MTTTVRRLGIVILLGVPATPSRAADDEWLWSTAHVVPYETTSEQSGYFSLIAGRDGRLYVGTAKYQENAFLVRFDPATSEMKIVVDAHHEIGTDATGFAAQAKIHTRNNVGRSGRVYFGTKQGYAVNGEKPIAYAGGYPMVYDPDSETTRVYPVPIPHHGIISVTPDESRGVAYVSTCSDGRPVDSTFFSILDLETGRYRHLLDCEHMYGFIVLDDRGRAYHPIRGGDVARWDPETERLDRLSQTIDGRPPVESSWLATENGHPINWDTSPDRRTLYAVAMSGNQLFSYDLTAKGETLPGRALGELVPKAARTDCRAMCVDADGTVWAGVATTMPDKSTSLRITSYRAGDDAPRDHGPIAISNPDFTTFTDGDGKPLKHHHGVHRPDEDGPLVPRYTIMAIAATNETVYVTTLYPFTLHAVPRKQLR